MKRLFMVFGLMLVACSTGGNFPAGSSLLPKGALRLTPQYSIAFADLVQIGALVGVVYMISDPTAPNWSITETRLPDDRVLYDLNMQRLRQGGDGEARYVLARRVDALVREQGFAGYRIDRYEEALDSRILLPRRTAHAEIRLLAAAGHGVAVHDLSREGVGEPKSSAETGVPSDK